jgi:hypothetical protein
MELVRWWRMDATLAYCVFRLRAGEPAGMADRVSQVQFEAEVLGVHRLCTEADLPSLAAGQRVVTSIPRIAGGELLHVVAPAREAAALARFTPDNVHPRRRLDADLGGGLRLLGVDLPDRPVRPGGRIVLSRYWQVRQGGERLRGLRPATSIEPGDGGRPPWSLPAELPCHGTCDLAGCRDGEVLVETYQLTVPHALPPGSYAVHVGVQAGPGESEAAEAAAAPALVFAGNLAVRR